MFDFALLKTVVLSLLPGIFWLVYLRSLSGGKGPLWWHWALAFLAGALSTQLTLAVSHALAVDSLYLVPYIGGSLLYFLVGVGLVEEAAKAVCALVGLKFFGLCRKPLLSLQLCGGVALGFATLENVLYARSYGDTVLLGRFVFSTLGHVLFTSVWGFALGGLEGRSGSDEREYRTPWKTFAWCLILSSFGHGVFDWFLVSNRPALAMLTLVVLWLGFREAVLGAFLHQEYQRELPYGVLPCPRCTVLTREVGNYCSFCGNLLGSEVEVGDDHLQSVERLTR